MTQTEEMAYINARFRELNELCDKRAKDLLDAIQVVIACRAAIEDLMDVQNGPPLYTYAAAWTDAMSQATTATESAVEWLAKYGYTPENSYGTWATKKD
jgi:hypothetical protein